ncbi:hypothetical protein FHG87_006593 [Trinorchestia longiramus]|nr:hypothetical protein FHG87_006593 [Trinorchestia longiramus]
MNDLWTIHGSMKMLALCMGQNISDAIVKNAFDAFDKCNNDPSAGNFTLTIASMESGNWTKLFDEFAANVTHGGANITHSSGDSTFSSDHSTDSSSHDTNHSANVTDSRDNSTNSRDNSSNSRDNSTNSRDNSTNSRDNSTNFNENSTDISGIDTSSRGSNADHSSDNPELYAPLIEKLRCAFEKIGLTKNNAVDVDGTVKAYESFDIPQNLKAEIVAIVKQCYELSQCLPLDKTMDSRFPKDVHQLKVFLECERYLRNWACVKSYVKNDVKTCEVDFSRSDGISNTSPEDEASTTVTPVFD